MSCSFIGAADSCVARLSDGCDWPKLTANQKSRVWGLSPSCGEDETLQDERVSCCQTSCLTLSVSVPETGSQPGRTAPRRRVCWRWTMSCTWLTSETAGYAGWDLQGGLWTRLSHCTRVSLQAVLCRMEASGEAGGQKKPVTLALSKEHNPTIYEERMRIQRAGGTVRYTVRPDVLQRPLSS